VTLWVRQPGRFSHFSVLNLNPIIPETLHEFIKFILTQKNENNISKFLEKKNLSNKNII
jgi:hypothetical protein